MKKLLTILLIAFFVVGLSSCAEEPFDTDPVVPEIQEETFVKVQDNKSERYRRAARKRAKAQRVSD